MFKSRWYDRFKILASRLFPNFRPPNRSSVWILYLLLLSLLSEELNSLVSCEFNFGYENAVMNITYVDPENGVVVQEELFMERLLPGENKEVTGIVVHVRSHGACEEVDRDTLPDEPFIALMKYGGCREQVKLRHLADVNAAAALLYNDNHNTKFIKLQRRANPIALAVISEKKGEWLANLVDNGTRVWMQIGISGTTNRPSILFGSIAFIVLLIFSFAWLLFYYIHKFPKQILSRHLCSAAKNALDKIPVKAVKMDDRGFVEDCAVCIEPFSHGELMRTLPCNHCFHKVCIDPWLLEQRSCPMCKLDILLHFGLVYTGSEESVLEIEAETFRRRHSAASLHPDAGPSSEADYEEWPEKAHNTDSGSAID